MARPRRIKFHDPEDGAYHIISRALQKKFIINEAEKQKFLSLLRWLSTVYFVRVATFSLMTTHVHLIIKMIRKSDISEEELKRRFDLYYNRYATEENKRILQPQEIPAYYERFSDVSRFMQDLKQRFSRWYNETHLGFGHVWAERFKSVLLVGSTALRACMVYVELNALRAGIVREPEKYPYCGLYFLNKSQRHSNWLDKKLLQEVMDDYENMLEGVKRSAKGLDLVMRYLTLVYEEGLNLKGGKASIPKEVWLNKMVQLPEEVRNSIYMTQIPHFSCGIILGNKEDCEAQFESYKPYFRTENSRKATPLVKDKEKKEEIKPVNTEKPREEKGILSDIRRLFSIRSFSI